MNFLIASIDPVWTRFPAESDEIDDLALRFAAVTTYRRPRCGRQRRAGDGTPNYLMGQLPFLLADWPLTGRSVRYRP